MPPVPKPQAPRTRGSDVLATARAGASRPCRIPALLIPAVLLPLLGTACRRSPLPEFDSESSTSPTVSTSGTSTSRTSTSGTSTSEQPLCGNGEVDEEDGEECDDGNTDNTDDCLSTCVFAHCGDGHKQEDVEHCDYGDIESGDGCSSTCQLEYTVFITAAMYFGNMTPTDSEEQNSLQRADANCQQQATDAGLDGQYQAWLSEDSVGPATRFEIEYPSSNFLLVDGTLIAASWQDLLGGKLLTPIYLDQHGNAWPTGSIWTGTGPLGTPVGNNCVNWTTMSTMFYGASGRSGATSASWTDQNYEFRCSTKARIYCFQVTEATR